MRGATNFSMWNDRGEKGTDQAAGGCESAVCVKRASRFIPLCELR